MRNLTNGKLLTKNILINMFSQILPIVVGILAIPELIAKLGVELFGVLTLAWIIIGFFGIFDLGIGRALTVFCSEKLITKEEEQISQILWTALTIITIYGTLIAVIIILNSKFIVVHLFNTSISLREETINVVMILATCIPLIICSGCMNHFLASHQNFKSISTVRMIIGTLTFIGPLLVLTFSNSITLICISLAFVKVIEFLILGKFCINTNKNILVDKKINKAYIKPLLSYGGWMTVSGIASSLMNYTDRFFIAALMTTTAVAFYVTPADLILRLMIIPGAIVGVLFPAFCAAYKTDKQNLKYLYSRGIKFTLILVFPLIISITILSEELLSFWLGKEFSTNSKLTLQYLAIGGLANSISYIPFAIIQAAGRPDLTGKIHILEFPLFVATTYILIKNFGIEGAAIGWMLRSIADTLILTVIANNLIENQKIFKKFLYVNLVLIGILIIPILFDINLMGKILYLFMVLFLLALITYLIILEPNEKKEIKYTLVNWKKIKL